MTPYTLDISNLKSILLSRLESLSDPKTARWWENYVKHDTRFRGVGIPKIREELKQWYQSEGIDTLELDDRLELALSFFDEDFAEDKLAGILFLQLYLYDRFDFAHLLEKFKPLFSQGLIYDWNVCDWFCVRVLGPMIKKNGNECAKMITEWNNASNVWQARCSVVAFAGLAGEGLYTGLILSSCKNLITREERFSKTAVGWILREMSKNEKETVVNFIETYAAYFSKESLENAVKYFPDQEKKKLRLLLKKQ